MISYQGYIIVDLDGTLANINHRRQYVESNPKNWSKFFEGIPDDKPNQWCIKILERMHNIGIIICTGRMEKHMGATREWLKRYKIREDADLFCRKDGDFRADDIVKEEIYLNEIKEELYPILFVIDDRKRVVDMWRKNGLVCLQCDEGNF